MEFLPKSSGGFNSIFFHGKIWLINSRNALFTSLMRLSTSTYCTEVLEELSIVSSFDLQPRLHGSSSLIWCWFCGEQSCFLLTFRNLLRSLQSSPLRFLARLSTNTTSPPTNNLASSFVGPRQDIAPRGKSRMVVVQKRAPNRASARFLHT